MEPTLYIETTIVGYLTSELSGDLITAAHQRLTRQWWDHQSQGFDLYVSELVIQEAGAGNPDEARKRLDALSGIPELELNEEVRRLARDLLEAGAVPKQYAEDAVHIAVSSVHGMAYLLTWNCAHMANAQMRNAIEDVCRDAGYEPPIICTPEELMGEQDERSNR